MIDFYIFNNDKKLQKKIKKDLLNQHKKFKKGYIIYAPPCSGKTYWLNNQKGKKKNWMDGDSLLLKMNAINKNVWKNPDINSDNFKLQYMRADYAQYLAKCYGFRIMTSNFDQLLPDAIVLIPQKLHKEYICKRGSTSASFPKFLKNITRIKKQLLKMSKDNNIPLFSSIDEAVKFLEKKK